MARTRVRKVLAVDLDLDETDTHWIVGVVPSRELAGQGVGVHRAEHPKCLCEHPKFRADQRCTLCRGWNAVGLSFYLLRLLRSYPKVAVREVVPRVGSGACDVDHRGGEHYGALGGDGPRAQ